MVAFHRVKIDLYVVDHLGYHNRLSNFVTDPILQPREFRLGQRLNHMSGCIGGIDDYNTMLFTLYSLANRRKPSQR